MPIVAKEKPTRWAQEWPRQTKPKKELPIIRPPYKIQNPSEPQSTPRNTPQILLQNQNTEKSEKYMKNIPSFVYFLYFFYILVLEEDLGVFQGVFWGSEGFCILYGGRMIATKERSVHELFPGAFWNKSSMCESRLFSQLGGNFGPEKKKFSTPPSQFPSDTLPAPRPPAPPRRPPPPLGIFE